MTKEEFMKGNIDVMASEITLIPSTLLDRSCKNVDSDSVGLEKVISVCISNKVIARCANLAGWPSNHT